MSRTSDRGRPEVPRASWWDRLWQPFWTLPAGIAVVSLGLGLSLPALDQNVEPWEWVFHGGPEGARSVLGTIAGAMISVTGLVFSITIVVLQLASSQYSPRVLANFLDSRTSQVTLGVFTGSFVYALTVLREVGGADDRVPQISVTVAFGYVLFTVAMFLAFIHHITGSVQVSRVMSQIRAQTVRTVHRLAPDEDAHQAGWSPRPDTPRAEIVVDDRGGYVTLMDSTLLVRRAADLGVVVDLTVAPGDYVTAGQVLGRAWGREILSEEEIRDLAEPIHFGTVRTLVGDVGLGVRQLLDIAERALSPGVNDPTTALQAMNELHAVLREMCTRPDPSPFLVDDEGTVRVVYQPQTYARALAATVEELVHYGRDTVRVVPHLRVLLADLVQAARPEHRAVSVQALDSVDRYLADADGSAVVLDVPGKSPGNP